MYKKALHAATFMHKKYMIIFDGNGYHEKVLDRFFSFWLYEEYQYQINAKSLGWTSHLIEGVILGLVLSIVACGSQTHTEVIAFD